MAISAGKVAPSAVILAFVGYCVWPSLSEMMSDQPPPKAPVKVPALAASLFSPTMAPVPTRNPWGGLDAASLAAAKAAAKEVAEKEAAKTADTTTGTPASSAAAKTPNKPVDPLAGLKLDATCILGNQRMAMINGQMCALHEKLPAENSSTSPKVVGVFPYKVLLEYEGKTVELKYSDAASQSSSSQKDKPGSAGKASGAKKPPAAATGAKSDGKNPSGKTGK